MIDPTTPAREWTLDPGGIPDIQALRAALPSSAHEAAWFSSDEPKALATAQHLTDSPIRSVPELREAVRTTYVADRAVFVDAVERGLRSPTAAALPGWEPLERTRRRITATVETILSDAAGAVVLVGHGTAWTLLVADLADAPPPVSVPAMAVPDLLTFDVSNRRVVTWWGDWRGPLRSSAS